MWLLVAQLSSANAGASTGAAAAMDTILASGRTPSSQVAPARRDRIPFDDHRFDSLTASALRSLFEEAADLGLPTRPLVNRALEGAARRTTSERIIRVVREHTTALGQARRTLGEKSTEDELEAGAIALRAGIDVHTLETVRSIRPNGQAVVPLVVLTDIVRRGVPGNSAREAVASIGRSPRSDDLLLGLQATVAKNAQRGPGMALDALNRYVRNAAPASSPTQPVTTDRKPVRPPES